MTRYSKLLFSCLISCLFSYTALAEPNQDYWPYWDESNESNQQRIDHHQWQEILQHYVVTNHPSGINRFKYASVTSKDKQNLKHYINTLEKTDPRKYNKKEQLAYWLNLYNALAVDLVLKNYPIKSMQDIGYEFNRGPWGKPLIKIAGQPINLNDIEHRILRPIWNSHKIHFGLNGGSMSDPSILATAFTGDNVTSLLNKSGRDYINHSRGLSLVNGKMTASSMFSWYEKDFAKDKTKLMKVFAHYAEDRLALYVLGYQGEIEYTYDWRLNAP